MSYTPREANRNDTSPPSDGFPSYITYHLEEDSEGIHILNFSPRSQSKESFPDYAAERQEINGEEETWTVRNGETVDVTISSSYNSQEELSSMLEEEYLSMIKD